MIFSSKFIKANEAAERVAKSVSKQNTDHVFAVDIELIEAKTADRDLCLFGREGKIKFRSHVGGGDMVVKITDRIVCFDKFARKDHGILPSFFFSQVRKSCFYHCSITIFCVDQI